MNRGVLELIDTVELAVSRSTGHAPRHVIAEAQNRIDSLRNRKGHFGEVLVVALAGGTGSGKSSLLNAVAGEVVAGVSVLRPHTQTPLAWIPADRPEGVERLLDDLEISQRVLQDVLPAIAFIDLPDIDSVADWHRQMVESLLPHVDAVLWVVDPEKYHDDVLHDEFLGPLAAFEEQFLFALNKIDRLSVPDVEVVREDLVASLRHDGFKQPLVFAVAAAPEHGASRGIDQLTEYLAEQVDVKRIAIGKAINDIATILSDLGGSAEVLAGGSVNFEARWAQVRDLSANELHKREGSLAQADALGSARGLDSCRCHRRGFEPWQCHQAGLPVRSSRTRSDGCDGRRQWSQPDCSGVRPVDRRASAACGLAAGTLCGDAGECSRRHPSAARSPPRQMTAAAPHIGIGLSAT